MIVLIDGIGANTTSVQFAIERMGKEIRLTNDHDIINDADYIILPGVGSAKHGMDRLKALKLDRLIPTSKQPVLGICLGMQLLFSSSEEGEVDCLDIISEKIVRFPKQSDLIIPHMGWNCIEFKSGENPLLQNIENESYLYFVHSYVAPIGSYTLGTTNYGENFSSIVQYKNFFGMQFHPERSGKIGEKLLENFLNLK